MLEILRALVKMEILGFPLSGYIFLFLSSTARQGVPMSLSHGRRQTDGKEEGKPKSYKNLGTRALFHGDHGWQPLLWALIPAVLCHATGAPVPDAERWHIFEVRKQSFQQLERHAKINPRFLADPFPSATVPARQTPARGSAGGNSPANSLCMGEIPSATEVIISQQEPTISFHLGTNSNNVRRPGEEGRSLLQSL